MAKSPLAILQSGIDHWNRWRAKQGHKPCSLAGQDLSAGYYFEGDFGNVDLQGANLQKSCLIGANFKNADLTNVNLTNAYIDRANFEGAILCGIDFTGTNISNSNLRQAMSQSQLNGTGTVRQHSRQYGSKSQGAASTAVKIPLNNIAKATDSLCEPQSLKDSDIHAERTKSNSLVQSPVVFASAIAVSLTLSVCGLVIAARSQKAAVRAPAVPETTEQAFTSQADTEQTSIASNLVPSDQKAASSPQSAVQSSTDFALVKAFPTPSQVWSLATHTRQDGHVLVLSGGFSGDINIWDGPTGEVLHTLTGHKDMVRDLAVTASGDKLISASSDGIKVWQPKTGKLLYSLSAELDIPVWSVAISPNEKTLISGDYAGNIIRRDLASGGQIYKLSLGGPIWSVAIAPDGKSFVSSGGDNTVRHWDMATGELIASFVGHSNAVRAVAISADGKTLVSGSWDSTIKLWDLVSGELTATLSGHSDRVVSLAISPDGKTLASSSVDSTLKLWNLENNKLIKTLDNSDGWVLAVDFDSIEQTLVSGGKNKEIKIWQ
mgnify:CR=1 FL=1